MKRCPLCSAEYETGTRCPVDGASLLEAQDADPFIGRVLQDAYRLEARLSEGAMSLVYIARQLTLNREVVVKLLRSGVGDPDFVQLFLREARIACQLNHPNIINVIDFGTTPDGLVFLVVEYLRGETLAKFVARHGPLRLPQLLWTLEQLAAGLAAAHAEGIVHRDLKPANIVVSRLGGGTASVKLLDFGISKPSSGQDLKHTRLGMVMGTPGYLAPEQIEGRRELDGRADLYGLAAVLYFLITGHPPYEGQDAEQLMRRQLSEPPPRLSGLSLVDPRNAVFDALLQKALRREPAERHADIAEFLSHARRLAESAAVSHGQTTIAPPSRFRYVYRGQLRPGASEAEVGPRLTALLHLNEAQAARLFSGKPLLVKKAASRELIEQLHHAFELAGAQGQIEAEAAERPAGRASEPWQVQALEPYTEPASASRPAVHYRHSEPLPTSVAPASAPVPPPRTPTNRRIGIAVLLTLLAALGVLLLVPTTRYALYDGWAELQGYRAPRGITAEQIRLGMSAPFHGPNRELGRSMQMGIEARFKEQNAAGGVHGRRLQLRAENDGYEPALAQRNLMGFLGPEGVFALLGNVGTPTAEAILPEALSQKLIIFGTLSGAEILRRNPPDRYVFNYRASYAEETSTLVKYFVREKAIAAQRIAVFYQADSFGIDGLAGVEDALEELGVPRSAVLQVSYPRNSLNVDGAVRTLLAQRDNIEAVIQLSTYAASAKFTQQLRQGGYRGQIANVSFVGSQALADEFEKIGAEFGDGVIVSQVVPLYSAYASGVLRYRDAMQRYYPNEDLGFVSLEGYVVASLLIEGLQRSGRRLDSETLVEALESFREVDLGLGQTISFHPSDHQGSHRVWATVLDKDGNYSALRLRKNEAL